MQQHAAPSVAHMNAAPSRSAGPPPEAVADDFASFLKKQGMGN